MRISARRTRDGRGRRPGDRGVRRSPVAGARDATGVGGAVAQHDVAQHDHLGIVRQLLAAGADPTATGDHGLSALGLAEQNGHQRTAAVLIAAGAA